MFEFILLLVFLLLVQVYIGFNQRRLFSSDDEVSFTIKTSRFSEDEEIEVNAKVGDTLLDVCLEYALDVEGSCGGECVCSTCHIKVSQQLFDRLPPPGEDEEDMLDLAADTDETSRLGCQVKVDAHFQGQLCRLPKESWSQLDN